MHYETVVTLIFSLNFFVKLGLAQSEKKNTCPLSSLAPHTLDHFELDLDHLESGLTSTIGIFPFFLSTSKETILPHTEEVTMLRPLSTTTPRGNLQVIQLLTMTQRLPQVH